MSFPSPIGSPIGRRSTLHEELIAGLREMIEEGVLPAGRHVPEIRLAEHFRVSRTPLREALKVLAAEGWVVWQANRGAKVAEIDADEIDQMFETLSPLERQIGRIAAVRISAADLAAAQRLHGQLEAAFRSGDRSGYFKTNQAIHRGLAAATGNKVLAATYDQLSAKIYRARSHANDQHPRWEMSLQEHASFMQALAEGDAARLADELEEHSEKTRAAVVQSLRRTLKAGPRRSTRSA